MRAELDDKGCLTIKAETPIESYALGKWWAGYDPPGHKCESLLLVATRTEDGFLEVCD